MRIAQVAPLYESVPPVAYGATERVVSYLTEALVALGHEVTLFATGDSCTSARLVATCDRGLWRDAGVWDTQCHHVRQLETVARMAGQFDVVHFHGEPMHLPVSRRLPCRHLTTMHGLLLPRDHGPLYREFSEAPLVSISDDQRRPLPDARWMATIGHGMPPGELPFNPTAGNYLAFMGRMMPEKRPDLAIEIARRSGLPLKMAAKIHPGEQGYFRDHVQPLIDANADVVEFLGEVGGDARAELLANARALIFPIDWAEPFGMVLIEAMSCGTPVIAFRRGAVPEVVDHGASGFIVDSVDEAVHAVRRLGELDRAVCRRTFEARFTATRMASDYVAVYEQLLQPASVGLHASSVHVGSPPPGAAHAA